MNDDAYAEWLVKRKDPIYAVPVKILMAVLCLVSLLIAMQTAFGAILLIAVGIAAYFVFINLSVEFEYLVVEGDVSIDRILARSRRKKFWIVKRGNSDCGPVGFLYAEGLREDRNEG